MTHASTPVAAKPPPKKTGADKADKTRKADKPDKRVRLLRAAAGLFHRQGYELTSLADIAAEADVPLGNVYYYYRTREELLKAVTEDRRETMNQKRAEWETLSSPRVRLLTYVDSFAVHEAEFAAHGCPAGSLCLEANKIGGEVAAHAAAVLEDSLAWLEKQFKAMGFGKRRARENAAHVLAARQGSVLLANTFKEPAFMRQEVERLKQWLADLDVERPAQKKGNAS